jgi:CDP-4-dehydro-6-deoxyglucose reductase, E3
MISVDFEGEALALDEGETLLECIERHGHSVTSSCRSGVCQSCLMHCEAGQMPPAATAGLGPAQRAQGYFLSCVCRPVAPLRVARIDPARLQVSGVVAGVQALGPRVRSLTIKLERPVDFFAGQFFNLILEDGTLRSYSAAAPPNEDSTVTFHIGLLPGGRFSAWASEQAQAGSRLRLQGPLGKCCYVPGVESHRPLLLAGTGTGLAPLLGIALAAIEDKHPGSIHLFHGALDPGGLYLHEELTLLANEHPQLHYHPCALNGERAGVYTGNLQDRVFAHLPSLAGHQVYLCGHPDFVKAMQRKCFLAGASLPDIHADAFLPSQSTNR